jgi:hypothetical protein
MKFKNVNKLQRFILIVILLGIVSLASELYFSRVVYQSNVLILNVRIVGMMKTYHDLDKNGMHLVYGTTGQIFYHPRSYFEVIKYNNFEQHFSDYLIMLILAVTIFILALKKDQVFFSKETIMKFYGVLFFYMTLAVGKWFLLDWIHNDFYNSTGHLFKLDIGDRMQPNSWQLLTMLFMFTVTGIIDAGIKRDNKDVLAN